MMKLIKLLILKIKIKFKNYRQDKEVEKLLNIKDPFIYT